MSKRRVLFICTGNSSRSQMAEGILRAIASDRFDVYSAGALAGGLNTNAIKVVKELGIDIYNRTMATSLLTEGGKQGSKVIGATAINIRTGEFFIIKAKAVVLTTGWISRLFFYAGNQWRGNWGYEGGGACSTGDGIAMAFRAGAELIQMESSHPSRAAYGSSNQPIAGGSAVDDRRGDSLWPVMLIDTQGNPVPTMMGPLRNPHGVGIGNIPFFIAPGGTNKWDGETLRELIKEGKVYPPLYLDQSSLREEDKKVIMEVNQGNEGGWLGQMLVSQRSHTDTSKPEKRINSLRFRTQPSPAPGALIPTLLT